jgi:hypothetical protein
MNAHPPSVVFNFLFLAGVACRCERRLSDSAMIEVMDTVRITEAELARDIHAVLAKVQERIEVIVEQDHRPVAVIKTPQALGQKISECIALAKAHEESPGQVPTLDPDFAADVEKIIRNRKAWNPPEWD